MRFHAAVAAIAGSIFLSATFAAAEGVTVKQVTSAKSGEDLVELGATRLSAKDFKNRILNKQMTEVGKGWTWIIKSNGTTQSAATDGSWSDDSKWSLKGDAYCRKVEGGERCSDIYMIGSYLRMTEDGNETLSGWTVKVD